MTMTIQKGWALHSPDGLLDQLVGEIIKAKSRYRPKIRSMAGEATLPPEFAPSESEQPEMPFGFY